MSKTSLEIYQDIQAINEGDSDRVTLQRLLKNLALGMANFAAAMETVSRFYGAPADDTAPEALITAASLYSAVDAINADDRNSYTINQIVKNIGLLASKLAIETEMFGNALSPQTFVREFGASMAISSEGNQRDVFGLAEAGVTSTPTIDKAAKKDSGASTTLTGASTLGPNVFNRTIDAGITTTPTVASVHTPLP